MKENKTIKMEIGKKELLSMLSQYYSEKLGQTINVKSKVESVLKGYGMGEYEDTEVELYFSYGKSIGPTTVTITTTLEEDDIKGSLNDILSNLNYKVESINYKKGIHLAGYYEHKEAYFNGISLDIKEKGLEKTLR